MNKNLLGAMLVSMAATAVLATEAKMDKAVKTEKTEFACQNNSCKEKADCAGFGNDSCKGNNECKGHGILKAKDKAACLKKTGVWAAKI